MYVYRYYFLIYKTDLFYFMILFRSTIILTFKGFQLVHSQDIARFTHNILLGQDIAWREILIHNKMNQASPASLVKNKKSPQKASFPLADFFHKIHFY